MKYLPGRVKRQRARSTIPARRVVITPEDRYRYSTASSYTPARLSALFQAANSGDIEQLCLCGREILERNWDIQGAMDQRADALCGVGWELRPGGPGEAAKQAAEGFASALDETGLLARLDRTLATGDARVAEVVRLRIFGEMGFREIAKETGQSEAAVKSQYHRFMQRFRAELERDAVGREEGGTS